ncbi:MAG: F0F1 ATP synthase subunit A [Candidatus Gracilibacteria bacterium]|nr:F0F1 ATP synthase subunit A [Candidatus Gracilibacteria bacterium]
MEQGLSGVSQFVDKTFAEMISFYTNTGFSTGLIVLMLFLTILIISSKFFNKSKFYQLFELAFENIYNFFEDILGKDEQRFVKMYIISLFFVILFSNLLGTFSDIILPAFETQPGIINQDLKLRDYISTPTTLMSFDLAMAIVSVLLILFIQAKHLGLFKFFHEYVPIFGKNYIPYEKGKLKPIYDIPLGILVKIFDIFLSLFLGFLDIIGVFAKVVSLSFRLFGNVTSGSVLLMMMVGGLISLTQWMTNIDFPVVFPLIVYLQGTLVALIQAFVFSLLVAIFIKVSKV